MTQPWHQCSRKPEVARVKLCMRNIDWYNNPKIWSVFFNLSTLIINPVIINIATLLSAVIIKVSPGCIDLYLGLTVLTPSRTKRLVQTRVKTPPLLPYSLHPMNEFIVKWWASEPFVEGGGSSCGVDTSRSMATACRMLHPGNHGANKRPQPRLTEIVMVTQKYLLNIYLFALKEDSQIMFTSRVRINTNRCFWFHMF